MRRLRWHVHRFGPHTRRFERTRDCGRVPRDTQRRSASRVLERPAAPAPVSVVSTVSCVCACVVGFSFLSSIHDMFSVRVACFGNEPKKLFFPSKRRALSFFLWRRRSQCSAAKQRINPIRIPRINTLQRKASRSTRAFPPQARKHRSFRATTRRARLVRLVVGEPPC